MVLVDQNYVHLIEHGGCENKGTAYEKLSIYLKDRTIFFSFFKIACGRWYPPVHRCTVYHFACTIMLSLHQVEPGFIEERTRLAKDAAYLKSIKQ